MSTGLEVVPFRPLDALEPALLDDLGALAAQAARLAQARLEALATPARLEGWVEGLAQSHALLDWSTRLRALARYQAREARAEGR